MKVLDLQSRFRCRECGVLGTYGLGTEGGIGSRYEGEGGRVVRWANVKDARFPT